MKYETKMWSKVTLCKVMMKNQFSKAFFEHKKQERKSTTAAHAIDWWLSMGFVLKKVSTPIFNFFSAAHYIDSKFYALFIFRFPFAEARSSTKLLHKGKSLYNSVSIFLGDKSYGAGFSKQ